MSRDTGHYHHEDLVATLSLMRTMLIHEGFQCEDELPIMNGQHPQLHDRKMLGVSPLMNLVKDIRRTLRNRSDQATF